MSENICKWMTQFQDVGVVDFSEDATRDSITSAIAHPLSVSVLFLFSVSVLAFSAPLHVTTLTTVDEPGKKRVNRYSTKKNLIIMLCNRAHM
jgi:hypothetical protein